ncbi:hypothetical protein [Planctomicrobium piriforme]|uniref:YXWGXW repeat-containing protein n=1 Tax=Planctomicrobium piriforme TaxID=1576369 RepID=A0A1I3B0X2_9PLAN|nr:hypothetical protein [Planctomicrobium piriforme]SFH55862.1 hypothetical protein SAMN05421753_101160 [Planctomicrobium piriforme]
MKRFGMLVLFVLMFSALPSSAKAQWVYRPVMVAPTQPVRMYQRVYYRRPMVVYQPTRVVYSRRRPVIGGYSVRTRPAYRRTVIW